MLGGQLFRSTREFEVDGMELEASPLGYYAWAQYQLTRTTYLGSRWDDTATIVDDSVRRRAIGGYFTWYTSEFLRFRLGYERRISDLADEDGRNSAFAEINFVFGAHPPEPFWVNR